MSVFMTCAYFLFLLLVEVVLATPVPYVEFPPLLVGSGATGSANQGSYVFLSGDGNTLAVGAYGDNSQTGATWIFVRDNHNNSWLQQGSLLVGTGAVGSANQGFPVCLSYDGNTLISAGSSDDTNIGAVWTFTRSNGVWMQEGEKLLPPSYTDAPGFGSGVALSYDGNTLVVGAPYDIGNNGTTWVFTKVGSSWVQQGDSLTGTGSVTAGNNQGMVTAISGDGNTLAIASPFDDSNTGKTWVFRRSNGVWTQDGDGLIGTGGVNSPSQGTALSLNGDGTVLAIAGPLDDSLIGATWIFKRIDGLWVQQGGKIVGQDWSNVPVQGESIALTEDGMSLVVGGPQDRDNNGSVWFFQNINDTWTQIGFPVQGTGGTQGAVMGTAVSISADGAWIAAGGNDNNGHLGATWMFFTTVETSAPTPSPPTPHTQSPSSAATHHPTVEPTTRTPTTTSGSETNALSPWFYIAFFLHLLQIMYM
jgi:hypothetical protein